MPVQQRRFDLTWPDDPARVVRGRVYRPGGPPRRPLPAVLLLHGFKGFMDWGFFPLLATGLAESGFLVAAFNASGSGVGEDLVDFSDLPAFEADTFTRQLEDVERVRKHLESGALGPVKDGRVGIVGHSRGGGVAVLHAARNPVSSLVAWAPIDTVERFPPEAVERWREQGHLDIPNARTGQVMRMGRAMLEDVETHLPDFDILAAAARVEAPSLVLHGTLDESVTPAAGERVATALPAGRLQLLEGAGHTFGATHPLKAVTGDLEQVLIATTEHLLATL